MACPRQAGGWGVLLGAAEGDLDLYYHSIHPRTGRQGDAAIPVWCVCLPRCQQQKLPEAISVCPIPTATQAHLLKARGSSRLLGFHQMWSRWTGPTCAEEKLTRRKTGMCHCSLLFTGCVASTTFSPASDQAPRSSGDIRALIYVFIYSLLYALTRPIPSLISLPSSVCLQTSPFPARRAPNVRFPPRIKKKTEQAEIASDGYSFMLDTKIWRVMYYLTLNVCLDGKGDRISSDFCVSLLCSSYSMIPTLPPPRKFFAMSLARPVLVS